MRSDGNSRRWIWTSPVHFSRGLIVGTSHVSTVVAEVRVLSQQGQHIRGVGRHAMREHLSQALLDLVTAVRMMGRLLFWTCAHSSKGKVAAVLVSFSFPVSRIFTRAAGRFTSGVLGGSGSSDGRPGHGGVFKMLSFLT